MRNKQMQKWIMYHEVNKQHREGLKPAQIARELVMDRRTVKKYLAMSEDEYLDFIDNQLIRHKVLAPYENFVRIRLEYCEEASAAQVHDWLKEHHEDFIAVDAKTVFNFVLYVRNKFGIPKPFNHRDYEMVPELPYGQQTQVDFGVQNMTCDEGRRKKIYFICFVLSRSRQKYNYYSDRPFTTAIAIDAHEEAIQFFGGITEYFVYDQDSLFLVDENKGDLIMTEEFRKYTAYRGFKLHFCRKSDPQSKGKVENVVKYTKYNFMRGRIFIDIPVLKGQSYEWLMRTANAKVHSSTKKVPHEEWLIEKSYLKPVVDSITSKPTLSKYDVRKDNVISYKGNFYRVPRGTYRPPKTTVHIEVAGDNQLIIYNGEDKKIIAHPIYPPGQGQIIGRRNNRMEVSIRIDQLIDEMASLFDDPEQAKAYFQKIREDKPRYIRDQLHTIKKLNGDFDMEIANQALMFCVENKIYRATDMVSVAKSIQVRQSQDDTIKQPIDIKTINQTAQKIIPEKSNISDYQSLMN
jgi:transposase